MLRSAHRRPTISFFLHLPTRRRAGAGRIIRPLVTIIPGRILAEASWLI
jgi:hypothetical protein